jgi:hypothetical protein
VIVEATLREAGMLHQFAQPDGLHSALSEKPRRRGNNRAAVFRRLFFRHAQSLLLNSFVASYHITISFTIDYCGQDTSSKLGDGGARGTRYSPPIQQISKCGAFRSKSDGRGWRILDILPTLAKKTIAIDIVIVDLEPAGSRSPSTWRET